MAIDIIKRKKGNVYRVRVILENGSRISKCFIRKTDAVQYEAKLIANPLTESLASNPKIKFHEFTDQFLKMHCSNLEFASRQKWECVIRRELNPRFGSLWIHSITNSDIAQFRAELNATDKSDSTKFFVFTSLKSVLKKAFEWGYLDKLLGAGTKTPRKSRPRDTFWTSDEIDSFLLAMKDSPRLALYILALNTGMRVGELLGLKWDAIDFKNNLISIKRTYCQKQKLIKETTKTHKQRHIGMNKAVHSILRSLKGENHGDLVFDQSKLKCKDVSHFARTFQQDCKNAAVKPIRFHDLRHTFATQFVMKGGSIFHLSAILGHSTTAMTARYAHYCETQIKIAASVVCFNAPRVAEVVPNEIGHKLVTKPYSDFYPLDNTGEA